MLRAILVDDDQSNLSSLNEKLTRHCPQVEVIGCWDDAEQAATMIDKLRPDLVFLDIEMPVMNGFVMLQQLTYRDFALVFVTAYDHYAIKAIKYSAIDYIVKPVDIEELKTSVEKAVMSRKGNSLGSQMELLLEYFQKKKSLRIPIPTVEGLQFLNLAEIVYLEASKNYTLIFLDKQKYLVSRTLKDFEDILPPETFIRIHHSHIINKHFVEKYIRGEGGQVVMRNGAVLDISKRKKSEFLEAIGS